MKVGIALYTTDDQIPPDELARHVRGARVRVVALPGSLAHPDEPADRRGRAASTGAPLPEVYKRLIDPFVALGAAAAVTTTLRIGTCVALPAQRDVLQLAKEVATVDWLSGGRMIFGIGFGWNAEEMADHGVAMADRWDDRRREGGGDEAVVDAGHGRVPRTPRATSSESWAWPKPVQRPHPPILIGGGWGPRLLGAVVPPRRRLDAGVGAGVDRGPRSPCFHAEAARQGRDPSTPVDHRRPTAGPTSTRCARSRRRGSIAVLLSVPPGDRDATLRVLESHGSVARAAA